MSSLSEESNMTEFLFLYVTRSMYKGLSQGELPDGDDDLFTPIVLSIMFVQ